jgi:hypothetical protein
MLRKIEIELKALEFMLREKVSKNQTQQRQTKQLKRNVKGSTLDLRSDFL